jgi:hypothetical protein
MVIILPIAFFIGTLVGVVTYKYTKIRPNICYLVVLVPYLILNFLSMESLYPELEDIRIIYFGTFIVTFIYWGIKDYSEKKSGLSEHKDI